MGTALLHNRVFGSKENNTEQPAFEYSGTCSVVDDGEAGWRIKFLTGGILTLKSARTVDIFAVGGGGGGYNNGTNCGGGGGGGYTALASNVDLKKGTYVVTIGAGGSPNGTGGTSSFADLLSANGGKCNKANPYSLGGDGGSGGGGGGYEKAGKGGSNGSDGYAGYNGRLGVGQHTTTREFHESGGTLYAGGGGGCALYGTIGQGGSGGGGYGSDADNRRPAKSGTTNTGGGGGGGAPAYSNSNAGSGGSGIVIIRNARG